MQYLLTEEEYNNLVPKAEVERRDLALKKLHELFFKHSTFKCIHDTQDRRMYGYCDYCPLAPMHPELPYEVSKLLCDKSKEYSK